MSEAMPFDEELKEYSELREKILDLYYDFYKQNKVFPNELHIQGSLLEILFQFSSHEMKEEYRFNGMLIITNPNPKAEVELKVSHHPLSAR